MQTVIGHLCGSGNLRGASVGGRNRLGHNRLLRLGLSGRGFGGGSRFSSRLSWLLGLGGALALDSGSELGEWRQWLLALLITGGLLLLGQPWEGTLALIVLDNGSLGSFGFTVCDGSGLGWDSGGRCNGSSQWLSRFNSYCTISKGASNMEELYLPGMTGAVSLTGSASLAGTAGAASASGFFSLC